MYNNYTNLKDIKTRILVIDNDPKSRVASQSLLLDWGYDPVLAMGTGDKLIADAKNKARDNCCALALIDMRLYDDDDNEDDSGLKLANELSNMMSCIILSGHENQLRKMLNDYKYLSFINKIDPPDRKKEIIDAEAKKVSAAKRGLKFNNLDIFDDFFLSPLRSTIEKYPDQLLDVLARLFPNASTLRLEKFHIYSSSSNISTAPRPNSIILKVYEDEYEPFVVKIARAEKIQKEVDNYKKYIYRKNTEHFTPQLVSEKILWDIGGAVYFYLRDFDVMPFSGFYEENSIVNIEESLKSFFNNTWFQHYLKIYNKPNVSLFNLYTDVWGNWYEKCIKAFPLTKPLDISFVTKELNAPEPINWLKTKIAETPDDESIINNTRIAVTHGDLHGDNLLVDSKKIAWVIDFERCGEGHALQDFIELETDIINRLGEHSLNPLEYMKMYIFILKHKKIQNFEDLEILTVSENKHIKKALQTISILRSLAFQRTGISDVREYVFGLLFNTVFRATIAHNKFPQRGQHQALMLASIICHRLDHWDELWPPLEWDTIFAQENNNE